MALVIDIKVVPSSGRTGFMLDKSGRIKCYVKSPAEKGLANRELIKTLAGKLNLNQDKIEIVTGLTSPRKRIRIHANYSLELVMHLLGCEHQNSLI